MPVQWRHGRTGDSRTKEVEKKKETSSRGVRGNRKQRGGKQSGGCCCCYKKKKTSDGSALSFTTPLFWALWTNSAAALAVG